MSNRRINGFTFFCQCNRDTLKNQMLQMSNAELTSLLAKKWRNLCSEQKEIYTVGAKEIRMKAQKANPCPKKKVDKAKSFTFSFKIKKVVTKRPIPGCVQDASRTHNLSTNIIGQVHQIESEPISVHHPKERYLDIEYFKQVYQEFQQSSSGIGNWRPG